MMSRHTEEFKFGLQEEMSAPHNLPPNAHSLIFLTKVLNGL